MGNQHIWQCSFSNNTSNCVIAYLEMKLSGFSCVVLYCMACFKLSFVFLSATQETVLLYIIGLAIYTRSKLVHAVTGLYNIECVYFTLKVTFEQYLFNVKVITKQRKKIHHFGVQR